mmetsp:Transcript_9300/g.22438  ORF Transcript_9300/g.22438 Transcript_9300/m.22438 type:complete len:296 (+) Transcript_9300:891-1778(+)
MHPRPSPECTSISTYGEQTVASFAVVGTLPILKLGGGQYWSYSSGWQRCSPTFGSAWPEISSILTTDRQTEPASASAAISARRAARASALRDTGTVLRLPSSRRPGRLALAVALRGIVPRRRSATSGGSAVHMTCAELEEGSAAELRCDERRRGEKAFARVSREPDGGLSAAGLLAAASSSLRSVPVSSGVVMPSSPLHSTPAESSGGASSSCPSSPLHATPPASSANSNSRADTNSPSCVSSSLPSASASSTWIGSSLSELSCAPSTSSSSCGLLSSPPQAASSGVWSPSPPPP